MVSPYYGIFLPTFTLNPFLAERFCLVIIMAAATSSIAISYFPVSMLITLYIRDRQNTAIILIYGRGSGDNISLRWVFFLVALGA